MYCLHGFIRKKYVKCIPFARYGAYKSRTLYLDTLYLDRHRNGGIGRDVHASRLAGGVAAIGALSLEIGGPSLPKHLESVKVSHIRQVSLIH